jgi:hypothetical protein
MTYYDTIAEDLTRAKEILTVGKLRRVEVEKLYPHSEQLEHIEQMIAHSGTIFGKDIFVAYKLLESFVAEIEYMQRTLAESEQARREQFHQLRVIREMADLATGIDRSKNDPRPSGALGAVQTLIERWRRGDVYGKNIPTT